MRLWIAAVILVVSAGGAPATDGPKPDEKAPAVRALDVKVDGAATGRLRDPVLITSREDLAKAIPDKAGVEAVAKAVDFKTEQVLYFAWAGSGQDRLTFQTADGKVTFTYSPGRTRDLRQHKKLFALPRGAKFQLVTP